MPIRSWIIVYLFFCQIYNGTINMCRQAHGQAAHMSTYGRIRAGGRARGRSFLQVLLDPVTEARVKRQDWCLTRLSPLLKWYQHLSHAVLVYVMLINVMPVENYANLLLGPVTNLPKHCLVPGRLSLYSPLPKMMACAGSIVHLAWRLAMRQKWRRFDLNMVACMIQDEELVEREHCTIARQLAALGDKRGLDQYQHYLSNLLYHQCPSTRAYILRPNRSGEARARLARFIRRFSLTASLVLLLSTCVITPIIDLAIVSDDTYIARYPGCSPHLEERLATGQWPGSISISWTQYKHKLVSHLVDLLVNFVVWFESGAAVAFVLSLTYLFNYDFLIYWSHIRQQLAQLDLRLKLRWMLLSAPGVRRLHLQHLSDHRLGPVRPEDLEENISQIQAHLIDFFLQLRAVDQLVSDIVTASLVIWWSIFTFCTLYFLRQGPSLVALEMRLIQLVAVLGLTVENVFLLALRRTINRSYVTLCSVMAYDSSRHRQRFTKILDYWQGASWTLFHRYAFTPTTTLTLLGWSFSLIIAGENFARKINF